MTEIIKEVQYEGKTLPLSDRISLYDLLICIVSNTPPVDERCQSFVKEQRQNIYKEFRDKEVYYESYTNTEKHQYASEKIEQAINKAKKEVFYSLMTGGVIARGKKATFSLEKNLISADELWVTESTKEENEESIALKFWYDEKVFWPDNVLQLDSYKEVTKEAFEYGDDYDGYYASLVGSTQVQETRERSSEQAQVIMEQECFSHITLATQDVIKIWPQLLEPKEMVDWEGKYNNLHQKHENECQQYKTSIKELEEKINKQCKKVSEPQVKRKLNNVLRLLYCISAEKYRYTVENSKSNVPSILVSCAERKGIKVSQETVREYLKEGHELVKENVE